VGVVGFPYVVSSSALGQNGTIAPSERIVMGCIGMGSQGSSNMRAFLDKNEVQIVAVCDVDKWRLDRAKGIVDYRYENNDCKAYVNFREVIARDDIDVLSLALPDHWHSIPVIMAARAGKDMYGEKPIARTIYEGQVMRDTVNRYGRIWQTGSWQRSVRDFRHACELVINGRIGKVHTVEVGLPTGSGGGDNLPVEPVPSGLDWNLWLGPAPWRPYMNFGRDGPHWDWRWIMDYSGGQLTDWAGHHIDIAHWGLGLDLTGPVEIEGKGTYPKDGIFDAPTEFKFTCKYANGLTMIVANDLQQPKGMGTVWYGKDGWIHVDRKILEASDDMILKEVVGPNEIRLYESKDHHQNFLDCVKSRQKTIAPIEIAHRSISVGFLGEIAMLVGRKLRWDPDKEQFVNDDTASRMLRRSMRAPWHI
jgi:predicted dehydrogenase